MANANAQAVLDGRSKREKHKNDFRLTVQGIEMDARKRLPKYADGLIKEMHQNVRRPFETFLDKAESIRTSGRFSGEGERAELRPSGDVNA
jgi:hypothetical protein